MSHYTPDAWVIVKITPKDENYPVHYRVFVGWYGGYAGSDSWKMNSGITRVVQDGDIFHFHGESGSVYSCYKDAERMTGYMMQIYQSFQGYENITVEHVPFADYMAAQPNS